ncbi:MAG: hypothetical protein R3C61_00030 [Bacteroidia bacterium]
MSLDEKRGTVFAPLGSPTYDFYGANRKGQNLYGNSLVALDAATGKLRWYFQTTYDLWDYDLPAPPTLLTVRHEGRKVDAVALPSKRAFSLPLTARRANRCFRSKSELCLLRMWREKKSGLLSLFR